MYLVTYFNTNILYWKYMYIEYGGKDIDSLFEGHKLQFNLDNSLYYIV